jgi:DNA polymerase (family X)
LKHHPVAITQGCVFVYLATMDNYAIADQLSLLSRLMEIHGENSFKAKSYSSAAFSLEKLPMQIADTPKEKIASIRGIGDSVGKKIIEILDTGSIQLLQELLAQTPSGVLEMMNIKGLGPKKINLLWKDMKIDTIDALREACIENRIADKKGFGAKTEQNILQAIEFQQQNSGLHLYARAEPFAEALDLKLKTKFPGRRFELSGEFRRQSEIVGSLDWVTTATTEELKNYLINEHIELVADRDGLLVLNADNALVLRFNCCHEENFAGTLFTTSCSQEFLTAFQEPVAGKTEEEIFEKAGYSFIPPFMREVPSILTSNHKISKEQLIQTSQVKGLIHSHSTWSDGGHSLEAMAKELIQLGFEYLVISDHSKAAFYANGLSEERIIEQHKQIDELNKQLAPFRIFKSIECDILNDGSLDYDDDVLSSFDLVITSIHSNQNMDQEKSMKRLLGAITNPYTTILGHMTGRLLLRRNGYPVDHKAIIDACAEHQVVIEINANPNRLDMDWRWIPYAIEKGVMLSINPDAHTLEEFQNIKYGVLVAQKGGLTKMNNLSSFSLKELENYLQELQKMKFN